ncbi:hypothetical protein [Patulibacter minatonensis]|uniref:hypothetical protein n=1 Tax=Patulibacter minatonensis TaxID=298163 RepID=UPI00047DB1ED|nr:hypothetical protein [Patulibacter minatonensis]
MRALGLLGTIVAVAAGATGVSACGGASDDHRAAIVDALRAYASADAAGDGVRVCAVLSDAAAGNVGSRTTAGKPREGSCVDRYEAQVADVRRDPAVEGPLQDFAVKVRDAARKDDALDVRVDGDAATVDVSRLRAFNANHFRFTLRREGGAWLVDRVPETATLR